MSGLTVAILLGSVAVIGGVLVLFKRYGTKAESQPAASAKQ